MILIVAAAVSYYLGQFRDGSILMAIVILNAIIGFYEEWKSENILASLQNLVVDKCNVIRDGKIIEIKVDDLVPGDIVSLTEGDGIPADIRMIDSTEFSANEFILTGESLPSNKDALFTTYKNLPVNELKNCVYMGTTVARGDATGIVYAERFYISGTRFFGKCCCSHGARRLACTNISGSGISRWPIG